MILDIVNVNFGRTAVGLSMTDQAIANLAGQISISGNAVVWASAQYHSTIRWPTTVTITQPVSITYFAISQDDSIVVWEPGCRFVNAHLVSGQQYVVYAGGVLKTNGIPTPGNVTGLNAHGTGRVY